MHRRIWRILLHLGLGQLTKRQRPKVRHRERKGIRHALLAEQRRDACRLLLLDATAAHRTEPPNDIPAALVRWQDHRKKHGADDEAGADVAASHAAVPLRTACSVEESALGNGDQIGEEEKAQSEPEPQELLTARHTLHFRLGAAAEGAPRMATTAGQMTTPQTR